MGDKVLLVIAEEGDDLVAGALNLIGEDTLFGRLWGCCPRKYYPSLHFEACYYQVWASTISFYCHICQKMIITIQLVAAFCVIGVRVLTVGSKHFENSSI